MHDLRLDHLGIYASHNADSRFKAWHVMSVVANIAFVQPFPIYKFDAAGYALLASIRVVVFRSSFQKIMRIMRASQLEPVILGKSSSITHSGFCQTCAVDSHGLTA